MTACPEVTLFNALARWEVWVGLGWNLVYIFAALAVIFVFYGAIIRIIDIFKYVIVWGGLLLSVGLMAHGFWPPNVSTALPLAEGAAVLVGAILFAASVFGILWVHKVEGGDPWMITTLFILMWGGVAAWYTNQWVGAMAVAATMHLLGFKLGVGHLSYAFGFNSDNDLARGTATGIVLTALYVGLIAMAGKVPTWLYAFGPGVFYVASFVAYTGMLILSFGRFQQNINIPTQIWMIVLCAAGISAGMMLAIQPLAVMAGVFGFLFFLSKVAEVRTDTAIGVGVQFGCIAAAIGGALHLLERYKIDVIGMMTALPA